MAVLWKRMPEKHRMTHQFVTSSGYQGEVSGLILALQGYISTFAYSFMPLISQASSCNITKESGIFVIVRNRSSSGIVGQFDLAFQISVAERCNHGVTICQYNIPVPIKDTTSGRSNMDGSIIFGRRCPAYKK